MSVAGRARERALVVAVLGVALLVASACDGEGSQDERSPIMAHGYMLELEVVGGLDGPTQVIVGPDNRLWIAQLAGGENEGVGQVVAVPMPADDPVEAEPEVLLDGLVKPTGIAVLGEHLWIQQRRSLLRAPLQEGGTVGEPEAVLEDLPFNGRSEGTLTVLPGGRLLYETSGAREGAEAQDGSGSLWVLDPGRPAEPVEFASGLKNAYGHTVLPDGTIIATDVLEPLPGVTPEDELNRIERGADYGWPRCVGEGQPVVELGVSAGDCEGTRAPLALLGTSSTPTSVVLAPWADDALLVARWRTGDVVRVPLGGGEPEPVVTGLDGPQHLLVVDGSVLLVEHGTGAIHRMHRPMS